VSAPERCAAALLCLGLCSSAPAWAVLGEGVGSVQADQLQLSATRRMARTLDGDVQLLTWADGSSIRQYLTPSGRVYAVAWNTRSKPRLDRLFGVHFVAYVEGARQLQQQRAGVRHQAVIEQGDLVVESSAHLHAHTGRAWLRSLLPSAKARDAIR
jgi:Protein of unknown function (DUF2844)